MSILHEYRCAHEEVAKEATYFAKLPDFLYFVKIDKQEHLQWRYSSKYHNLRKLGRKKDGYWHFSIQIDEKYAQQVDEILLSDHRIERVPPKE